MIWKACVSQINYVKCRFELFDWQSFCVFWQSNTSTSAYAEVTCNTPNDNKYQDGKVETDIKN